VTGAAAARRVYPAPGLYPAPGPYPAPDRDPLARGTRRNPDPTGPAVALHTGWARALRGAVAGSASAGLSLAFHAVGGGPLPGAGAVLLAAVVASGAAAWWAGCRRGPAALILLTCSLQVALHTLFQLLAGHDGAAMAASSSVPAMTAAHGLAAVAVAWLLARGEDALWELCGALTGALVPVPAVRCPAGASLPAPHPADTPSRGIVLARARPRRGPPLLSMV
jgi:hypothetical protein